MPMVYHIKTALPGLTFRATEERLIAQEEQALLPRKRVSELDLEDVQVMDEQRE